MAVKATPLTPMLAELVESVVEPLLRRRTVIVGLDVYPLPPGFTAKLIVEPLFVAIAAAPEPPPPVIVTVGFVAKLLHLLLPVPLQVKFAMETNFKSVTWPVAPLPGAWVMLKLKGAEV